MKRSRGFSIVESLIVLAFFVIILAILVPSLLESRMKAHEATAIANLEQICQAEAKYAGQHNGDYTGLKTLIDEKYLGQEFLGVTGHYTFDIISVSGTGLGFPASFSVLASPVPGYGRYAYGIGPDQVVRYVRVMSEFHFPRGVEANDPVDKALKK